MSIIRSVRRYSYDEVDKLLDQDTPSELLTLYNIASESESARIEKGALKINKNDAVIVIGPNHKLQLVEIDENSPARSLVGEMMVLANSLFADFGVKKNVPLYFRSQEAPDESTNYDYSRIPEGPALDYAKRAGLKKSVVSTRALPHSTLGLKAYCQITSPIRRYVDLLNQRNIVAALRGQAPLYTKNELEELFPKLEENLSRAMLVTRETKKFWLLRYIEETLGVGARISGTVTRTDLKNPIAELDKIFLPLTFRSQKPVQVGQRVDLKIVELNPRYDFIRLEA